MKLTAAEKLLLQEARDVTGMTISPSYAPANKLKELGLIELRDGKFGTTKVILTDTGRAVLEGKA